MTDQKPTSQTFISREFHWGEPIRRDKLIKSLQWNGPQITHNFYECFAKKQQRAEEYEKQNRPAPGALRLK